MGRPLRRPGVLRIFFIRRNKQTMRDLLTLWIDVRNFSGIPEEACAELTRLCQRGNVNKLKPFINTLEDDDDDVNLSRNWRSSVSTLFFLQ